MGGRRGARPAGLTAVTALLAVLLSSGHSVRATEFYCDEASQSCRSEPCDTCSMDVIYRSATECALSCTRADSDVQSEWSCVLPPEQGPCRDRSRRWHFDLKVGECRDFSYGGCLGNANNFGSLAECRRVCEYRIGEILPMLNVTFGGSGEQKTRCLLPRPDTVCAPETETDGQPRFAYHQPSGLCRSFEWAGCEPEGNVFTSQLACQIQCEGIRPLFPVHPPLQPVRSGLISEMAERVREAMPEDEDHDPCLLPADPGTCGASSPRLYYDADLGLCRRFQYGGCGGNLNNFLSLAECYGTCNSNATETSQAPAACRAPKRVGTCSSNVLRFYYDTPTARCRAFRFSGCDGSKNNFFTLAACVSACRPPAEDMPAPAPNALTSGLEMRGRRLDGSSSSQGDVCSLAPAVGPCDADLVRWHYDPIIGRCRKFLFGGCEGNGNNFANRAACEDSCGRRRPAPRADQCSGPPKEDGSRFCNAKLQRYAFSEASGRCERFIFDGCGATANNYRTVLECESACRGGSDGERQPAERVCRLLPDPGRCDTQIDRYYYEPSSGRCRRLIYRGCRGNANNFQTMRECMSTCRGVSPDPDPVDPSEPELVVDCAAPPVHPDSRACSESIPRFSYSVPAGRCERLLYGGCGATDNNFATMRECERSCPPGSVNQTEVCLARPRAAGNCLGLLRRYTYDPETGSCSQFEYTGCGGNDNNFSTRRECLDLCRGVTREENKDMCTMPMEMGPCSGRVTRYYYDPAAGRCERFTFGGCEGNGNNFVTRSECSERCSGTQPTTQPPVPSGAICRQRSLVGPCADSVIRFYFDQYDGVCQQFIYSGCGGNDNNFETRRECERSCPSDGSTSTTSTTTDATSTSTAGGTTQSADELCYLPLEVGPCFAALPRFYYDPARRQCRSFTYGGCSGNANNFVSLSECSGRCVSRSDRPARCLEPGSAACEDDPRRNRRPTRSFFFDARSGRCVSRAGGDCGARNSFISAVACRDECAVPLTARAVCSMPVEEGDCAGRERRWAYDARAGRCQPFEYGGCGGNANNFASLRECLSSCRGMALRDAEDVPDTCLEPPAEDDFCEPQLSTRRLWTFNAEKLRCETFKSRGCEVGRNIHQSRSQCERSCQSERPTPPPEEASCQDEPRPIFDCTPGERRIVYFYVANRDTCLSLSDGGCLSGSNKYPSREACMRSCSRDSGEGGDKTDSAVCRLPVQPGGICKARMRRWAYSAGRCQQFFYSGCDGNANNFETEQECRELCDGPIEPIGETPEYCLRPPRRLLGCRPEARAEQRFYFNRERGTCDVFFYDGCDSGGNMFSSRRACMTDCMRGGSGEDNEKDEQRPRFCNAEPERLPNCRPGRLDTKYYFSRSADRCLSMQSVGCERKTSNLFDTLSACEETCDHRDTDTTESPDEDDRPSFCSLAPRQLLGCRGGARQTMYTFSSDDGRCRVFTTYGCHRGRNMFSSMSECAAQCGSSERQDDAVCSLRPAAGRCSRFETRWYRDPTSGTCETFQYGGCGGNGNNFASREACLERCDTEHMAENAICNQPPESDDRPCQREEQRYYWDTRSGVCRSYDYSGCGATENNFASLRDCTDTCRRSGDPGERGPAVPERCLEEAERKPDDAGGCGIQAKRYSYSSNRGFCIPFTYTGCEETENNFMTRSECRETCQPKDQCLLEMDAGLRCDFRRPMERFAYDPFLGGCRRFRYNGCGGNANRFATERACLLSCGVGAAAADQEVCLLPPNEDGGVNCGVREDRFFFDSALDRCVSFTFTGCLATANNFLSMAGCQERCPASEPASTDDRDMCTMDKMPGSCLSRVLRYFYDASERRCRPFIYTGCDGNANNFLEFRDCTAACDSRRSRLERGEAAMLSELRLIMDEMAPADKMALESTAAAEVTPTSTLEP